MGLTKGWYDDSDDPVATAEEIAGHLDDITTQEGFTTPMTIREETVGLMKTVGIL